MGCSDKKEIYFEWVFADKWPEPLLGWQAVDVNIRLDSQQYFTQIWNVSKR
jgi:hypothetical protein